MTNEEMEIQTAYNLSKPTQVSFQTCTPSHPATQLPTGRCGRNLRQEHCYLGMHAKPFPLAKRLRKSSSVFNLGCVPQAHSMESNWLRCLARELFGKFNMNRAETTGNGRGSGLSGQKAQEGGDSKRTSCLPLKKPPRHWVAGRSLIGSDRKAYDSHGLKECN